MSDANLPSLLVAGKLKIMAIKDQLYKYLLSDIHGLCFEAFCKELLKVENKENYIPLGGMHDGGADGYLRVYTGSDSGANVFYQFSVTKDEKKKVKETIDSLRKAGREPRQLIYLTNQHLPKQDVLQKKIFSDFGVLLIIHDYEGIKKKLDGSPELEKLFFQFFDEKINEISEQKPKLSGAVNNFVTDPTVFALLDYELKGRGERGHLDEKMIDSLIYWSLRNTGSEKDAFCTRKEIKEKIKNLACIEVSSLMSKIDERLNALSKRSQDDMRIRHYKKEDKFCLSHEMKIELIERSLEETALQEEFYESIQQRIKKASSEVISEEALIGLRDIIFFSVHEHFVEQGLVLSAFLEGKLDSLETSEYVVEEQVSKVISSSGLSISPYQVSSCMSVLREIFYESNECERAYLAYLSRTSLFFMTLRSAPRMLEFFNKMSGKFRLIVGSDILVKAISEHKLEEERRHIDKLLHACIELGVTFILTEPVLEEVFTHLHAVDLEYRNHFLPHEPYLKSEHVTESDRILIRAYYYYQKNQKKKISWDAYLNEWVTPRSLRSKSAEGKIELSSFLCKRYRMDYFTTEELLEGIDEDEVRNLAQELAANKSYKHDDLPINDSIIAHSVYALRRKNKERNKYDGFGFRTWWLTKETFILRHTKGIIQRKGDGVPYMMRPEFLLDFIVLSPKAAKARETLRELLPSSAGLQIGLNTKPELMHELLSSVEEWEQLSPDRVSVLLEKKVNQLKYDRYRSYSV